MGGKPQTAADAKAAAALELPAWEAPRPETVALFPRHDRFYSTVALVVAALGAVIIFAFGQAGLSPFARQSAAAPVPTVVASPTRADAAGSADSDGRRCRAAWRHRHAAGWPDFCRGEYRR